MTTNADSAEIDKFAGLASQWWDPLGPLRTLHEINPLRVSYIREHRPLIGARVLDVGCGGGLLAEALAAEGAEVVGIDMAPASIAIAREHATAAGLAIDYRVIAADALADAEPESFDAVTCLEVLEHVPDPAAMIAACALLVRPGGDVFLSTINRNPKSFAFAILGAEYLLGLVPRGTHQYLKLLRPSEVASACRAAELDVESLAGLHFNPLTRTYRLGGNVDVNYFMHCSKRESRNRG